MIKILLTIVLSISFNSFAFDHCENRNLLLELSKLSAPISEKQIKGLLHQGKYALISAGRNLSSDEDKKLSDKEILERHKKLEIDLKNKNLLFFQVEGSYGGVKEDSFLALHEKDSDILELGNKYNQESVIVANCGKQQMVYTTGKNQGKAYNGQGHKVFTASQVDNFTSIKTSEGKVLKFSLNFNFDETVEYKESSKK